MSTFLDTELCVLTLAPRPHRTPRGVEHCLPGSQLNTVAINDKAPWMASIPRRTDRWIRKFEPRLRLDELADPSVRWFREDVH